jgi:hypothetical protein
MVSNCTFDVCARTRSTDGQRTIRNGTTNSLMISNSISKTTKPHSVREHHRHVSRPSRSKVSPCSCLVHCRSHVPTPTLTRSFAAAEKLTATDVIHRLRTIEDDERLTLLAEFSDAYGPLLHRSIARRSARYEAELMNRLLTAAVAIFGGDRNHTMDVLKRTQFVANMMRPTKRYVRSLSVASCDRLLLPSPCILSVCALPTDRSVFRRGRTPEIGYVGCFLRRRQCDSLSVD